MLPAYIKQLAISHSMGYCSKQLNINWYIFSRDLPVIQCTVQTELICCRPMPLHCLVSCGCKASICNLTTNYAFEDPYLVWGVVLSVYTNVTCDHHYSTWFSPGAYKRHEVELIDQLGIVIDQLGIVFCAQWLSILGSLKVIGSFPFMVLFNAPFSCSH